MKKTTTINLAGMVYHIEEDAFQILKDYLTDIKRVFSNQEGVEEMVADIEARIAELFQERLNKNKEVVTYADVEEVIAIMGSPNQFDEDYDGEENATDHQEQQFNAQSGSKRLYRDTDEGMLAGVSAGLGHYLNIDPLLIRVLWIVLVLVGGSGVLVYIIAWIAIPEAKTTAQKLQMKGQPANLDNIKAFADSVKEEAKTGFKRASDSIKNSMEKSSSFMSNILKVFGKIIGVVMFVSGILGVIAISVFFCAGLNFIYISDGMATTTDFRTVLGLFFTDSHLTSWVVFIVLIVPAVFLIIVGEMLTFNRRKKSRGFILILLIVWFAAITTLAVMGVKTGMDFKETYKNHDKIQIDQSYSEIKVNFFDDDILITNAMNFDFDDNITIEEDKIKLGYINVQVIPTKDSLFYYTVERSSSGGSLKIAKDRAEKMQFEIHHVDSVLNISTRYNINREDKIRGQKIHLKIHVPFGKQIVLNGNLEDYPLHVKMNSRFSSDFVEQSSRWVAGYDGMKFIGFVADEL